MKITRGIAILGAGNIGTSIAEGILQAGFTKGNIILTRQNSSFTKDEEKKFNCLSDNKYAVLQSDVQIVAVQPRQANGLFSEIKSSLDARDNLLISVVSGISIEKIEALVGKGIPIARAMPNTAIRVRESMTCLAFNEAGKKYRVEVEEVFRTIGKTLLIPETRFAEATVLCGSGTALALKFLRAYMQAGIQHGFNEHDALTIAGQVLKGAAMITGENGNHPESQIDKVTTPGGCTIAALTEMEHAGFSSALLRAIEAGIEKAQKLY